MGALWDGLKKGLASGWNAGEKTKEALKPTWLMTQLTKVIKQAQNVVGVGSGATISYTASILKLPLMIAAAITAIVTAIATLNYFSSSSRNKQRFDPSNELANQPTSQQTVDPSIPVDPLVGRVQRVVNGPVLANLEARRNGIQPVRGGDINPDASNVAANAQVVGPAH